MADNLVNVKFTADLSQLQSGLGQAQKGMSSLGTSGTGAFKMLATAATAFLAVITTGEAVKIFAEWEKGIINLQTQLGKARDNEIPRFKDGLKELAMSSGTDLSKLSGGLTEIVDRGIALGDEMNALTQITKLSVASNESLDASLNAVDVVMKQFGTSAGSVTQVTDKLFETARAGTISVGELGEFIKKVGTVASGSGVNFDDLTASVAYLTEQQVPARQAQQALIDVLQEFNTLTPQKIALLQSEGVSIDENSIKNEGLLNVLKKVMGVNEEALAQIFPQIKNREILLKLTENMTEVEKKRAEIMASSGVVDEEYKKRQESLDVQLKQLQQSFKVLMVDALTPIVPAIKNIVTGLIDFIAQGKLWVESNKENFQVIGELATMLAQTFGPALKAVFDFIKLAIDNTLDWIGANKELIVTFGTGVVDAIKSVWEWIMKFNPVLKFLVDKLTEMGVGAYEAQKKYAELNKEIEASTSFVKETSDALKTLTESRNVLNDTERKALEVAKEQLDTAQKEYIAIQKKQGATEAEKQTKLQYLQATQGMVDALVSELDATNKSRMATENKTVATGEAKKKTDEEVASLKASELQKKSETQAMDTLIRKYVELAQQYDAGKISSGDFQKGMEGIVTEGQKVTGSVDEIIAKLKEVNATDISISAKVRLEGTETLNDIKDRILTAQEDLVLSQASGEERKRLEIDITLKRALRSIQTEMEAQMIKYNEAVRLIKLEAEEDIRYAEIRAKEKGMKDGEYVDYRKKLLEADLSKQTAVNAEIMNGYGTLQQIAKQTAEAGYKSDLTRIDTGNKLNDTINDRIGLLQQEQSQYTGGLGGGFQSPVFGAIDDWTRKNFPVISAGGQFSPGGKQVIAQQEADRMASSVSSGVAQALSPLISGFTPSSMATPQMTGGVYKSFQEGTDYVPYTGVYQLHKGEAVVTAQDNLMKEGQPAVTVINLIDQKMIPQIMAQYPNAILNVVNADILRNGMTRRVVKTVK